MKTRLVSRILWQARARWELLLAGIGFFLGLTLFLFCLQVYIDIDTIFSTRLELEKQSDYLIISKRLAAGDFAAGDAGFSTAEQAMIAAQPFTLDLGAVLSNTFSASAGIQLMGNGFSTELFFEAVEERFLDIVPAGWNWQEDEKRLPVIISRDFLLLYNFGFSQARGLPFVSEEMLKLVPVQVEISDGLRTRAFNARIAGLSDRIASLLVPFPFLTWANAHYGPPGDPPLPLRLILSVKERSDPAISAFLAAHGYETSREKLRLSDAGFTIRIVLGLIAVIGLVLILLSFVVFITTFRLTIARSQTEIALLIDLGYEPAFLVKRLLRVLFPVFAASLITTACAFAGVTVLFRTFLTGLDIRLPAVHWLVPATGLALAGLALLLNYLAVKQTVQQR